MVTNSRMRLRLPIRVKARSPLYFRSCEATPMVENGKKILSSPIGGGTFHVQVGHQAGARADFDFGADDAERADVGSGVDARGGVDDGCRMNRHLRRAGVRCRGLSSSLHITSASATRTPSTVARPAILATVPLRLITFISMRN